MVHKINQTLNSMTVKLIYQSRTFYWVRKHPTFHYVTKYGSVRDVITNFNQIIIKHMCTNILLEERHTEIANDLTIGINLRHSSRIKVKFFSERNNFPS